MDAAKRNSYIHKLHKKGLSIRQISRLTGLPKKNGRKQYIKQETREPSPCLLQTPFPGGGITIKYHGKEMTPESLGNFTYGMIGYAYGLPLSVLTLGSIYNAENFFTDQAAYTEEIEDWGEISAGYAFMQEYKWDKEK